MANKSVNPELRMKNLQTQVKRLQERKQEVNRRVTSKWDESLTSGIVRWILQTTKWGNYICRYRVEQNGVVVNGEPLPEGTATESITKGNHVPRYVSCYLGTEGVAAHQFMSRQRPTSSGTGSTYNTLTCLLPNFACRPKPKLRRFKVPYAQRIVDQSWSSLQVEPYTLPDAVNNNCSPEHCIKLRFITKTLLRIPKPTISSRIY